MEVSMSFWSSRVVAVLVLWNVTLVVSAQPDAGDVLRAFKLGVGDPPQLRSWRGDPCLVSWRGVKCGAMHNVVSLKVSALGLTGLISSELEKLTSLVFLWLDGNHLTGSIPPGLGKLKNLTSLRLSGNNLNIGIPAALAELSNLKELYLDGNQLHHALSVFDPSKLNIKFTGNADLCTSNIQNCGPSLAPALVLGPGEGSSQKEKGGKSHVAPIAGAVAGAVVLVAIAIGLVSICLIRVKRWPRHAASDTASSDPSAQDWPKGPETVAEGAVPAAQDGQYAKQFTFQELQLATKGFNASNMIGEGRFGFVFKGLLEDGTIVAIKTRTSSPTQEFITEAVNISRVRHRSVVSLLGFCQEREHQMIVYDYLPNGSVSSHLYDANGNPKGELDFKQRLAIALSAARGLEHLHTLNPPRAHQDFKTSNVLLDENLLAKVTDVGLSRLLVTTPAAMSSANGAGTSDYSDPAAALYNTQIDHRSDVYSYGVFLFELMSGREAVSRTRPQPSRSIVEWAWSLKELGNVESMVDQCLVGTSSIEDVQTILMLGVHCTAQSPESRPTMNEVAKVVEQIFDKERGFSAAAEAPTVVTLGSELFT